MPKHIHADLISEYARLSHITDRPWEYFEVKYNPMSQWESCTIVLSFSHLFEYRLKPRTIKIGEYDVPEPVRFALECGDTYFVPSNFGFTHELKWLHHSSDYRLLSEGLVHRSLQDAELHAKALISLTQKQE